MDCRNTSIAKWNRWGGFATGYNTKRLFWIRCNASLELTIFIGHGHRLNNTYRYWSGTKWKIFKKCFRCYHEEVSNVIQDENPGKIQRRILCGINETRNFCTPPGSSLLTVGILLKTTVNDISRKAKMDNFNSTYVVVNNFLQLIEA